MNTTFDTKLALLIFTIVVLPVNGQSWKSGMTTVTKSNGIIKVCGNGAMEKAVEFKKVFGRYLKKVGA